MGCDPLDPTREGEIDVVAAIRHNGMRGVGILTQCAASSVLLGLGQRDLTVCPLLASPSRYVNSLIIQSTPRKPVSTRMKPAIPM